MLTERSEQKSTAEEHNEHPQHLVAKPAIE